MKRNSFLIVSKQLVADKSVSATAKLLFAQLCENRNSRTGQCNPKRRTLAEAIGVSVDKVDRAAQELQRAGYLTWKRGRYTAAYEIPVPQECGTEHVQFRKDAEVVPQICGTAPPVPLYEPSQGEDSVRAPKRASATLIFENPPNAPPVGLVPRKDAGREIGWTEMLNQGRFMNTAEWQQFAWLQIIRNNRKRNGVA